MKKSGGAAKKSLMMATFTAGPRGDRSRSRGRLASGMVSEIDESWYDEVPRRIELFQPIKLASNTRFN